MASEITLEDITLRNYLIAFANGQNNVAISNYFAYATDLDKNFELLRAKINSIIQEFRGISGPSSLFGSDLLFIDGQGSTPPDTETGRIGVVNVVLVIDASPVNLNLTGGIMSLLRQRTTVQDQVLSASSLIDGTYRIGIDINGQISASLSQGQQLFDIADVTVVSNVWVAITDNLQTFLDGDEWLAMRTEPANTPFVAGVGKTASQRLDAYSRLLGGFNTATNGDTIGPLVLAGGSAAAPSFIIGDGAGNNVTNTGFFTNGSNSIRFSSGGVERFRWNVSGMGIQQGGSVAAPTIFYINDSNTGMFSAVNDVLSFVTGGTLALELNASQVVTMPQQPAGYVSQASQVITTGAGQAISYGTELFDRANQHATVNLEIVAGQAGIYQITAESFAQRSGGGTTASTVSLEITQEGVSRAIDALDSTGSVADRDHQLKCSVVLELAVNDTIQVIATQGSVTASMTFSTNRLSWAKIA